jgi:hypothetical protein
MMALCKNHRRATCMGEGPNRAITRCQNCDKETPHSMIVLCQNCSTILKECAVCREYGLNSHQMAKEWKQTHPE